MAGTVTYYYSDPQGNVLATADEQGNVKSTIDYRPFGQVAMGGVEGPGYTSHVHDDETTIYMQARYYDPTIGRFLSTDAVKAMPGSLSGMNPYAYVSNNPINRIDPSGNYERGTGWTDETWKRFKKAQERASQRHHKTAGKLYSVAEKMALGEKLSSSDKATVNAFESIMGQGSATADNLAGTAAWMTQAAGALDAGPGSGLMANASTASEWQGLGLGPGDLAGAEVGGHNIYINTAHASYRGSGMLEWAAGHESLHTVGLTDQRIDGRKAYKYAEGGFYYQRLTAEDSAKALINPDHLTDLSQ